MSPVETKNCSLYQTTPRIVLSTYQTTPGHNHKDETKHREKNSCGESKSEKYKKKAGSNTKDADEADALGEVDVGPEGKSCDDEDGDAGDAGCQHNRLEGVADRDDPDKDAVQDGQHTQQDDVERIIPAHLKHQLKSAFFTTFTLTLQQVMAKTMAMMGMKSSMAKMNQPWILALT